MGRRACWCRRSTSSRPPACWPGDTRPSAISMRGIMSDLYHQIEALVNQETHAWDTQDVSLLLDLFHPDMVWPWPRTPMSHDPADWILEFGRYDRERWGRAWQSLFDTHTLVHNRRAIVKIAVSDQGDGAF